ncbi:MAG: PEGA domain-containing protein [Defluviitaleaceae bacterium]|nr:PEGA domain-containing protein [Defluviitaleaceae bacterium]
MDDENKKNDHHQTKRMPTRNGSAYSRGGQGPDDLASTRKIMAHPEKGAAKPPKKPIWRTNTSVVLVTTVFVGILAAVFIFAVVFNHMSNSETVEPSEPNGGHTTEAMPPDPTPTPNVDEEPIAGAVSTIGLVQSINPADNRLDIYVFEDSEIRSFYAANSTIMRNKFGGVANFSAFCVGDVVEIAHIDGAETMETVRISARVDTLNDRNNVIVEPDGQTLLVGGRRFNYSPHTIVRYHGIDADITDIHPVDVVNIDIFGNKAVFVDIQQGSGTIIIPSNDIIRQGAAEIGAATFTLVPGEEISVRVAEGEQSVTIRGANIEPFTQILNINRNGTSYVDFDDLQRLSGELTVVTEDPYVTITIDGSIIPANQAVGLYYGTYMLEVTRDGYDAYHREITMNLPEKEIAVTLESIISTRAITITTTPPGAWVFVGGDFVGTSPTIAYLDLGQHGLTLVMPGYLEASPYIMVEAYTTGFDFVLTPAPYIEE